MNKITTLLIFALIFLMPNLAFAAESTAAAETISMSLQVLFGVLAVLINWLVYKGIRYFEGKTKIDIPKAQEEMLESFVLRGINFAEEKSYKFAKEQGDKLKGSEKLEEALKFVLQQMEEYDFPAKAEDKLVALIESKLGETRGE